jgi:hypothetical protein
MGTRKCPGCGKPRVPASFDGHETCALCRWKAERDA